MTSDHWQKYVVAESACHQALQRVLSENYGQVVRSALLGRATDGPKSFRAAVGCLDRLPAAWLESNVDVLLDLAMRGGAEWFMVIAALGRIGPSRLDDALRSLADDITSSDTATRDDHRALIRLLRPKTTCGKSCMSTDQAAEQAWTEYVRAYYAS